MDKNKLRTIENDIFSFGKNKLKQKHFQMFIHRVTWNEDYKIDIYMYNKIAAQSNISNKEKKEDENETKELDSFSEFSVSMISPTLTASTALTRQFDSSISINESTIRNGDTILFGRGSVANTYINTIHDTISDQAQYFESFQELQSQSPSQSMGIKYQAQWGSIGKNDSVLVNNFTNALNYSGSVPSFIT